MFERFTRPARDAVIEARKTAIRLNHASVGAEHVLYGVLCAEDGLGARILTESGVRAAKVEAEIAENTARRAGLSKGDADALRTIGVDPDEVVRRVEESFGEGALGRATRRPRGLFGRREGSPPFSRGAKDVLERSLREALALKHNYIGTEHILLGLLRTDRGVATDLLAEHDLSYEPVRQTLQDHLRRAS